MDNTHRPRRRLSRRARHGVVAALTATALEAASTTDDPTPTEDTTSGGTTLTDSSYTSANTSITVSTHTIGTGDDTVTYHVADVTLTDASDLRTGLAHLAAEGDDGVVVTADADGQHAPEDVLHVASACAASGTVALGVHRFGAGVPLRSRIGNLASALVFRAATGWALSDTQTGLRAFPARYEVGNPTSHFHPVRDSLRIWRPILAALPPAAGEHDPPDAALTGSPQPHHTRHPHADGILGVMTMNALAPLPLPAHDLPSPGEILRRLARAPFLRFAASSFSSTVVDWVGVLVLNALLGSLLAPVVIARIASCTMNFLVNRRIFAAANDGEAAGPFGAALKYAALSAAVMTASYLGISALTATGVTLWVAKLAVDSSLFVVNYTVQRLFVHTPTHRGEQRPRGGHSLTLAA